MEHKKLMTSVFVILFLLVKESLGMRCYVCGSLSGVSVGEGCLDPFKAYGITSTDCRGSCMKSKIETDNKQVVARSCSLISLEEDCEEKHGVTVCWCNSDLCNTAPTLKFSSVTMFVIVIGRMFFTSVVWE